MDGSAPSIAALDHAVALASQTGASVDILHVDPPGRFDGGLRSPPATEERHEADEEMDAAIARAEEELGGALTRRKVAGDALCAIVDVAVEGQFDVIVMGTHGRIGRLHAIRASVAEGVVRSAPCPVLTVREPSREYQSFARRTLTSAATRHARAQHQHR